MDRCLRVPTNSNGSLRLEQALDHHLSLLLDDPQVILAAEALRVDLIDLLGAGWTRGEPAIVRRYLDPAKRRAVAGRNGQLGFDRLAVELRRGQLVRRQLAQQILLLWRRWRIDPLVVGLAQIARQFAIPLAGAPPVRAVISAASSPRTRPSLSVVHTVPSRRSSEAPALSSPAKPKELWSSPST